jgi:hypothetical protein
MWEDYKLPLNSGNWTENTIDKIDEDLRANGKRDFLTMSKPDGSDERLDNDFSYFTSAYLNLNNLGFKADEIKGRKGFRNHFNDASHAFYGAHCDYFVVLDKKMRAKTRALYEKFEIPTKIMSPDEFLEESSAILSEEVAFFDTIQNTISKREPVDFLEEDNTMKTLFRLPTRLMSYFTHLQTEITEEEQITFFLAKQYDNLSDFMFYTEHETVFNSLHDLFGGGVNKELELEKFRKSYSDNQKATKDYHLTNMYVSVSFIETKFFVNFWIIKDE